MTAFGAVPRGGDGYGVADAAAAPVTTTVLSLRISPMACLLGARAQSAHAVVVG
jgi:hypothetical protein